MNGYLVTTIFFTGLLVGTPVLGKIFKLRDTVIVMLGATSHFVARIIFATVSTPVGFYVGKSSIPLIKSSNLSVQYNLGTYQIIEQNTVKCVTAVSHLE